MLRKLFVGLAVLISVLTVSVPVTTQALFEQAQENACKGVNATDSSGQCKDGAASLSKTIKNVINVMSAIVGVVAVIMVIVGGLRYVTSNGDSQATASARSTIIYALVGLVLAAVAQVIVQFVLERTT